MRIMSQASPMLRFALASILLCSALTACIAPERQPNDDERFYIWLATVSGAVDVCEKIGSDAVERWEFNPPGYKVEALKSRCVRHVAMTTQDPKLCGRVSPVTGRRSSGPKNSGEKYDTKHCREAVRTEYTADNTLSSESAERAMEKLGYSNAGIFRQCEAHFSSQAKQLPALKTKYDEALVTCRERVTQSERTAEKVTEEEIESLLNRCEKHARKAVDVWNHYAGKVSTRYPYERRYWYCATYCEIKHLTGECNKIDATLAKNRFADFLTIQALYGDLVVRVKNLPNY